MPGLYDEIAVQPADRLLLLGLPAFAVVRGFAQQAPQGIIVGIGLADAVYEMRRALADLDNVMLVPAAGPLEIPWRDEFFTKVIAPAYREAESEMLRVLVPGGSIFLDGSVVTKALRA